MSAQPRTASAQTRPRPGRDVPRPAAWYGGTGLIPIVVASVGVWLLPSPWDGFALDVQLFYCATIIAFLGAAHWGLALAGTGRHGDEQQACSWTRLGWSVAPALVAWLSLVMVPLVGLVTQILAFVVTYFADAWATRQGLAPPWYPRLRRPLTAVAVAALGASLLKVLWLQAGAAG
jgi:hypothetical protein